MLDRPIKIVDAKYFGMKFTKLVPKYPLLNNYLINKDPPKFDLGDPLTLSVLNKCLYLEFAGLDITVPKSFLIPSYSLRVAYSSIIVSLIKSDNKPLIEIGTGASAAIAQLLAKKYARKVVATEINEIAYNSAKANIRKNNLENSIKLLRSKGEIISDIIPQGDYSALLCYPPIYANDRTILNKKRGWRGVSSELFGGEKDGLSFSKELLSEALNDDLVKIKKISIQVMNIEQLKALYQQFCKKKVRCNYAEIIAGTRKRYVLIIENDIVK